jgi:hypothetical protein
MRRTRDLCGTVVEKPFGKCPFGRPRRKWENNVKICSMKLNYEGGSALRSCPEADPSNSDVDFSDCATAQFVQILMMHGTDY